MSNIHLKVTIEKNRSSQNCVILSLKICLWVSFRELQLTQISLNFKTFFCNLKIKGLRAELCVIFYYFSFERNYDILKSKSLCILFNKNINFDKNKTESKMENPTHSFKETNLMLQFI